MSRIADNILSILGECRVEGDTLFLPDRQLDRPTYQAVNKVLVNIGGKWNRKAKGHVFADGDPAELLNNVLMTGETVDLKKQYQFFPTTRPVAEQMCRMAELDSTCIALEPSCGKGDLPERAIPTTAGTAPPPRSPPSSAGASCNTGPGKRFA